MSGKNISTTALPLAGVRILSPEQYGAGPFGTSGPRRAEPGYDYIIQGLTGWMDITAAAHTIVDIVGCAGLGAFFFDDQAAIKGLFTIQGVVGV